MKRKFLEKLKKLKNKRATSAAITAVFAALLTVAAVTGQKKIDAALTNTGAPGSVSVSSIKSFGGGEFVSDYQGAYFYIVPDTSMANNLAASLDGTLIKTGRNKTETYRDLINEWDSGISLADVNWPTQYLYSRTQGVSHVPAQTTDALMFVPYTTYAGTSLKTGWKANISAVCYYNKNASSPKNSYKLTTNKEYLNNRIFAPTYDPIKFSEYCQNGVFYDTLAKWTADTDRKLSEDDLEIKRLRKKLSTKTAIKNFVAQHPGLQTQGYNLWCYILSLDGDSSTYSFEASEKITRFLTTGYNNTYTLRNAAYNKTSNPIGVGLGPGLSGKYRLQKWTDFNVNNAIFKNNKFAQREYNLHMLDLMLCAYAASVKQGATASVKNAWLKAICNYVNNGDYSSDDQFSPAFPIAICGGTIARGGDLKEGDKTATNRVVYVGTQDLVNFAEQLENASNEEDLYERVDKTTNSRSVTKSYIGAKVGGSGDGKTYLLGIRAKGTSNVFLPNTYRNFANEEAFAFGKKTKTSDTSSDKRFGKTFTPVVLKELPEYYTSYYKRLKSAMNGGEAGKVKNLESTSASEITSWHSNVVLRAVINTMYTRDSEGSVKEVTAKSDRRETIKLVKQTLPSSSRNILYQYRDSWGAMFIPSYLWPVPDADYDASFGVVLTTRSTLYAQGKKSNKTATFKDVDFYEPKILKTQTEKNDTWKENHNNLNDRRDYVISTRELVDNNTTAESFRNNKETVQLQAQVVYPKKDDKKKFQTWYNAMDKDKLKITMTVTPLYGETITTAKGKNVKCTTKWNTSYTGTSAKSVSVTLDDGSGTSVKLLNSKGCKVSKKVFESIFLPKSGLEGTKLILDTDSKFFKDTGFDVPQSKDGKKYVIIGYQISLKASGVKASDGTTKVEKEVASNKAGIRYSRTVEPGNDETRESSTAYNYTSIPEAYSELKEGSVLNEQYEAMAGVPSTRSLYFSTGGSEFIVNVRSNYEANQKAERTYHSHFNGTACEYKETDQLKSQNAGGTATETFVADADGKTQSKSVTAQENKAVSPTGAGSSSTAVSAHGSATTFKAEWTGTIANKTSEPSDVGTFNAGKAGNPCAGKDFNKGTQRTKGTATTSWDTSGYNTAIDQAIAWAKAMEETNSTYTVKRIADSDGQIRLYKVGDAVIKVSLTGGDKGYATECGSSKSYSGGTYTSATASGAKTESSDSGRLGSGWSYTAGKYGTGSGYNAGHGHGNSCPGHTDSKGNKIDCPVGEHNCGTFTQGTDIQQGASDAFSYTITVTFKNGKVLSGGNYDGKSALTSSEKNVGASLPAHALCGPCCSHDLPAVEDKWTQISYFDTMTITDMQVWKLESGYVQGISEITEGNKYYEAHAAELSNINEIYDNGSDAVTDDEELEDWETGGDGSDEESLVMKDRIYAAITQSDPNIFYNIAAKNVQEGYGSYNTSKVGRLRYSLQTGQDDNVYYEEKNAKGELHRSNKCDGTAKTQSSSNPVASGGKGHKDQNWSKGCLYSNSKFVNAVDYHKTMTTALKTGYNGQTLTAKKTDTVDKTTEEWKRFDTRRHQKVSVTVVSDFLILQTSSGDQSVLYHAGQSKTVDAQQNFGEIEVDTDKSNAAGFAKMFTNNSLAMKQGTAINIGSYNGNYSSPSTKYRGTGNGQQIATAFDSDAEKYNGITDELGLADVKAGHSVTASPDRSVFCPGAGQQRLARVNGLVITKTPVIQCPTNINKEYTTGLSYAFYRPLVKYTDNGLRYTSSTLEADGQEQEALRENENRTAENPKEYKKLSYSKKDYYTAGYTRSKDEFLEDEIAMTGGISADDEEDSRYLRALGKTSYGILVRSIYTKGKTKCNDIVVHDPVSTQYARVMRLSSQGDDLDQRTSASYQDAGGAAAKNEEAAEEGNCPGLPGECNFRVLNCKYAQEIVRAAFDMDTYSKTLVTGEEETDEEETGNTPDITYTEDDYTYSIYSTVTNENSGNPSVSLAGSGFLLRSESGEIPPEEEEDTNKNYWLSGSGNASLPFAFYKFNIDSANKAERVRLEADFKVNSAAKMPLFTTAHTQLFVDADGYLSVKTDDGAEYRSTAKYYSAGAKHRIGLSICFGTISDFTVTVDSAAVTFTRTKAPAEGLYEDEVCGPEFFLGNNEGTKQYTVNMNIDNLKVTRLPGTTGHTDACYKTETVHSSAIQNTYNGMTENSGTVIDWTGKNDDGSARVESENNKHTHSSNCLTEDSAGYNAGYENGVNGDATDLEKMTGDKLWKLIVEEFDLQKDKNGKYSLGTKKNKQNLPEGTVYDYSYTGNVQSVTLPAGCYKLETWGAQGGSSTAYSMDGENGGYASGIVKLDREANLYITVGSKGGDVSSRIDGHSGLNNNGGYNGGGSGSGSAGPGGGGATHVATSSAVLSSNGGSATEIPGLLMIAGGGGGGKGTAGTYGNNSYMNGGNGYTGYSGSYPYDNGGGGAGYKGGLTSSGDDSKCGYGGSSYTAENLAEASTQNEINSGNGRARITVLAYDYIKDSSGVGGMTYSFDYTGDIQSVILPAGTYQLETWGASGGQGADGNWSDNSWNYGKGGYSSGILTLDTAQTLYIGVGGRGLGYDGNYHAGGLVQGGYNGGGDAYHDGSEFGGSGGGATHIALSDGTLASLSTKTSDILLVAGGGGGSGEDNELAGNGGSAATAPTGYYDVNTYQGSFGQGTNYVSTGESGGGGGGGYTGGYGGQGVGSNGGTGYADTTRLTDISGETGVNTGNGKAVITCLSLTEIAAGDILGYGYTGKTQKIILPAGTYTLEAWGAQGGNSNYGGTGGKGGYSKGTVTFDKETTLYLGVGGSGYTFNGGGQGYGAGANGGGATHIALQEGELSDLSSVKNKILLAAGGGGGAQKENGAAGGGANLPGEKPAKGYGTAGEPGTLTDGYAFGKGGPSQTGSDGNYGGAGGGGYYGGYGSCSDHSNIDDKGGAGGSGYADTGVLTDISGETGVNEGNGKVRITAVYVKPNVVDKDELFAFISSHRNMIADTITTEGHTIINPIWNCKCAFDRHVCTAECRTVKELKCSEPHHTGKHYDYSSRICYDACNNDENHKQYQTEVTDDRGNTVRADNFILLDNYFDVYFPNKGDYHDLDSYGILDTQIERGRGYSNAMDTTEWTREKWIKFPYSVLYNRNGIWEEHPADEWFQIEIFDTNGNTLDTYHFYCQLKNREMGSGEVQYAVEAINHGTYPGEVEKMTTTAFYHERHLNGIYPYEKDAELTINCPMDGSGNTNRDRYTQSGSKRYWSYEDSWNHTWIDVIGRIGNLLVDDTDDLRFSNYFKKTTDDGWLIDGVLRTVDPEKQNRYMSWRNNDGSTAVDIRGEKVCKENEWYNTYQTQKWTEEAGNDALPIQASKNTVYALRNAANELRLGYDVLWDISSIGNYENGTLQVIPYYYALNIKSGDVIPVDVYADSGNTVQPINFSGLFNAWADGSGQTAPPADFTELSSSLYAYNMTLNWKKEAGRRNYKGVEKDHTESLAEDASYGAFAYNADGDMVMRPITVYDEENGTYTNGETPLVYNLTIPYGDTDFILGTEQLLYVNCEPTANGHDGGRARTFIGSPVVTALGNDINGSDNTNLLGTENKDYYVKGQRWHLKLGLPSTAQFVAYRGKHVSPNDLITVNGKTIHAGDEFKPDDKGNCDYVILMTADIKVLGDTYNLEYSQGGNNGVFKASNGKTFRFGNEIPTLIGVYGIGDTNTPDLDIMQTH